MSKKFVAAIYAFVGFCLLATSAFAVNMNNAGWYLHVDLKNLEKSEFSTLIDDIDVDNDDEDIHSVLNMVLGKDLKEQIDKISIYGDQAGYNDFTIIAQGNFTKSAKETFFKKISRSNDYTTKKIAKTLVHQWVFDGYESEELNSEGEHKISISLDEDDKPLELFAAEIDSNLLVLSRDEDELKAWIKGSYSKKELSGNGVFSVVVHLDRAIAHGGLNFGEDIGDIDFGFDSKLMQKVSQVSFSVREEEKDALIEVGLVTKDEKVAMQLKNVVNGFIALTSMAGEMDDELISFVSNLNIDVDGVNLILKSKVSTEQLKQLVD